MFMLCTANDDIETTPVTALLCPCACACFSLFGVAGWNGCWLAVWFRAELLDGRVSLGGGL